MTTGIDKVPVQPPEHDHLKMLADWYGWIIFGLVTFIVAAARAVGKLSDTKVEPVYVTQEAMTDCQKKLMEEFKSMKKEISEKIESNHQETNDNLVRAHSRIDTLYQRDP